MAKVGWIGLGNMGNPMSRNLIKAGHEVTVWNRTKAKAQEVLDACKMGRFTKEAVEQCDIISQWFLMIEGEAVIDNGVVGLSRQNRCRHEYCISCRILKVNDAIEARLQILKSPSNRKYCFS